MEWSEHLRYSSQQVKVSKDAAKCIDKLMDLFVSTAVKRATEQADEALVTGDHVRAMAKSLFLDFH